MVFVTLQNLAKMKKIKEIDLVNALNAIRDILLKDDGILPKEYDGYAASFGPAIINSGLLPALSFNTDIHKASDKVRRFKFLKVLYKVIEPDVAVKEIKDNALLEYTLNKAYSSYSPTARPGALGTLDKTALNATKKRIMEAAVAVKLAMRNFKHSDSES